MSNVSGSKINSDLSFSDIKIEKKEKKSEIEKTSKLQGNEELFKSKSSKSSFALEEDLEEFENFVVNSDKVDKINYFSRDKYLSDNRTLEKFKESFLKIDNLGTLTKEEKKEYNLIKKILISNEKPRELLKKIDDLSSKLKTKIAKNILQEYKELNIKNVFNSIELNSNNINQFINNFKKATDHGSILFDNNKNMKGIYSALDSLSEIIKNDDSNFKSKISALKELKSEVYKFISKNENSTKIQWVKLLNDFLGESIKLETDKLNYSEKLSENKLKIDIFSKAQKDLGKVFDLVNDFNSRSEGIRNFSKAEDSFFIEQRLMKDMQNTLSLMSNEEFLDIYKNLTSMNMAEFRIKLLNTNQPLTNSFLQDLNNFEAMIYTELSNRTFSLENKGSLSNTSLAIITETENIGSKKLLNSQTDKALKGEEKFIDIDSKAKERLEKYGINPKEFIEYMKSSELTINVSTNLFLDDMITFDENGKETKKSLLFDSNENIIEKNLHIKNIFEIAKENPEIIEAKGGDIYLDRRKIAEQLEFPILEKIDSKGLNHENHPVSAGLNVGKRLDGSASGYGQMFFVLKDEVKNRSTYTPLDSFYTNKFALNKENISSFKEVLKENFKNHKNLEEIMNRIDYLEGANFSPNTKNTFLNYLSTGLIDILSPEEDEKLRLLALKHLSDKSVLANMGNTINNIYNIINDLNEEQLKEISEGIKNKDKINLKIGLDKDYIEAQVHGGVDFKKDVKEIRVTSNISEFQKNRLEKLSKHLGIKVTYFNSTDSQKELLSMDPTVYNKVPKIDIPANKENKFKEKELFNLLDKYKSHEQTFDSIGYHGRRHITRSIIFSNVLSNILKEKGANIDTSLVFRGTALHDSGRENNGRDIYEEKSANNLENYLVELGVDNQRYLKLSKACIESEKSQFYETLEMGILKSADSLDITRVGANYDSNFLWFMKNDIKIDENKYIKVDNELRNKIIDEAIKFTSATDPLCNIRNIKDLKLKLLELPSDNKENKLNELNNEITNILGDNFDNDFKDNEIDVKIEKINNLLTEKEKHFRNKIQELNQKISKEIFENIENELFSGKYPTLQQYYDKEYKFSFPEYPDQDLLISNTLEKIKNEPLSKKILELDKLSKNENLNLQNQEKVKIEINKLIGNNLPDLSNLEFSKKFKSITESKLIGIYSKLESYNKANTELEKLNKLQDLLKLCKEYKSQEALDKSDLLLYFIDNLEEKIKSEKGKLFNKISDKISEISSDNQEFVENRKERANKFSEYKISDSKLNLEYLKSLSSLEKEKRNKVLFNIISDIENFNFEIYNKTELKQITDLIVHSDLTNQENITFIKKLNIKDVDLRAELIKNLIENNKLNLSVFLEYGVQDFLENYSNDIYKFTNSKDVDNECQKKIKQAQNYILNSNLIKNENLKIQYLPTIQETIFRDKNENIQKFFEEKNNNLEPLDYMVPLSSMMTYTSFINQDNELKDFSILVLNLKNYISKNSDAILEYAGTVMKNFDFDFFKKFQEILKLEDKEQKKEGLEKLLKSKDLKFIQPEENKKLGDNAKALKVINEFLFKQIE